MTLFQELILAFCLLFIVTAGCGLSLTKEQKEVVEHFRSLTDDEIRLLLRDEEMWDGIVQTMEDAAKRQGKTEMLDTIKANKEFMKEALRKEAKRRGIPSEWKHSRNG